MTVPAEPPASNGQGDDGASLQEKSLTPPAARGRVPDFFIVGHPKCGTTALYEMLRRHPQIYMPDRKEPGFFASDLRHSNQPRRSGAPQETYEEYLALFDAAAADQIVGEASTGYIWSRTAPGLIADAQPSARIIDILREPASLVHSLHLQLLENRSEEVTSLRKAIALEDARREGRALTRLAARRPQVLIYTDRVHYVEQLRRYDALFPREQVLVLVYDDFRSDNEATLRTVQRFLGVEHRGPVEVMEANPTVRRRVHLDESVRKAVSGQGPVTRSLRSAVKLLTPTRIRREALGALQSRMVFAKPRAPDEGVMLELRRRFKPEVEALSAYLDRDLVTLWGYEKIS
jgi:hypothetical protein